MKLIASGFCLFLWICTFAQTTPFEKSKGTESATYFQAIDFYKQLDKSSAKILAKEMGLTDAGYPLHLVMVSNDGGFDPKSWRAKGKVIVMVNNGIHPGEPDGIDASLMLVRDIAAGLIKLPDNVCLGIIPVYNIGGSLNRGSYSRANQNGPREYGFRGNSQYLDLNRDFCKVDSREAIAFAQIFHYLQPDILIDNHVSDGADFQHVFTLLTTQYNKLSQPLGQWLRSSFEPALYKGMDEKGWKIFPYVNFDSYDLSSGMTQFYDPPRYSSGYAALFQTIGFVPETHMLKPYYLRVKSTYDFMTTVITKSSAAAKELKAQRQQAMQEMMQAKEWPLAWNVDKTKNDSLTFLGYERDTIISQVTGLPSMQYNRNKPFTGPVKYFSYFNGEKTVRIPSYYVVPQGWHDVTDRLQENNVQMLQLKHDTTLTVTVYKIDDYKTSPRAYEKHYRHSDTKVHTEQQTVKLLKGDYFVSTDQPARRYLVEMLEPTGDDSFFSWSYFDAILQQKEGYSDYRWDQVAADWLQKNPALKTELDTKKKAEPEFAKNSGAILNWVYKHSPYYEPGHMRYPVFRIE